MFTPHCQAFTFFRIPMVTGLHSLSTVPQTTQLFQKGKCCHPRVKESEAHIDVWLSLIKSSVLSWLTVPTICGGWQWLYQLSLEVLWPAEVGSGCTNCLWMFCDLQRLAVAVLSLEGLWPAEVGNGCTNCLWRFAVALPTICGGSMMCNVWQLYCTNCLWQSC